MQTTLNNSSYSDAALNYGAAYTGGAYDDMSNSFLFDVTDVANCKFKMRWSTQASTQMIFECSTAINNNSVTVIRLGDT